MPRRSPRSTRIRSWTKLPHRAERTYDRHIRLALVVAAAVLILIPNAAGASPARALGGSGTLTFDYAYSYTGGISSEGLLSFKEYPGRTLLLAMKGKPGWPLTTDHPRALEASFTVVDADNARGRCKVGAEGHMQMRAQNAIGRSAPSVIFDLDACGIHDGYFDGHGGDVKVDLDYDDRDKTPWKVGFKIQVVNDGARKTKPKIEKLDLTYKMASRFYRSFDGLFRFPESKEEIDPDRWNVAFSADPCEPGEHQWTVEGQSHTSKGCTLKIQVPRLGPTDVSVTAGGARGSERLNLKDWLVLGIGDSLASGEGVPDIPSEGGTGSVVWGDRQCHRSFISHQAKSAFALDQKDKKNSVTFVHLACSGAAFSSGLFGQYEGIDPSAGSMLLGQMERFRSLAGDRKPDAVMVSIGVNHAHFGGVLGYCTVLFESIRHNCRNSHVRFDDATSAFVEDSSGPQLDDYVRAKLGELPAMYQALDRQLDSLRVKPSRVYIVVYPDPTRESDGRTFCSDFLSIAGLSPDIEDIRWLANGYALPLNRQVAAAAKKYHWNLVNGYSDEFTEHGYCASERRRWIVTLGDSLLFQHDQQGAVHPNPAGHREIAKYESKALIDDLLTK